MHHGRIRWATDGPVQRESARQSMASAENESAVEGLGSRLLGTRLIEAARAAAALHMAHAAGEVVESARGPSGGAQA